MCSTFCWGLKDKYSWEHPFFFVASRLRSSERIAQFSVQLRVRFKKSNQHTRTRYLCLLQYFHLHSSTPWDTLSRTAYVELLTMFLRSGFLSSFMQILLDFCKAKFFQGTSLIFFIIVWSYATPLLNWCQIVLRWVLCAIEKDIAIRHKGQKENKTFNKTLICG